MGFLAKFTFFSSDKDFTMRWLNRITILILLTMAGCDSLQDINEVNGPCEIILIDGTTIIPVGRIKISDRTRAITYRGDDGKLWSLFPDEYKSYSCN